MSTALRGCIGTILPAWKNLAEEIIRNAVSAATEDPRFPAVRRGRAPLPGDQRGCLKKLEDIRSEGRARCEKVRRHRHQGGAGEAFLLPDLEGVDTVDEQIRIAKRKAGIGDWEVVSLQRFAATRHQ